ncbi:MAG: T9SS C-terminal target domain-containing protein [Flavobacteriia bacterium]|nr:T9SS C-terminal target domain-containing protein [Flavobacteriia bacterium]
MKNNPMKFGRLFALILVLANLSGWAQPVEAWFMPRQGTIQPPRPLAKTTDTLLPPFVDGFSHRLHPAWTSFGVIAGSQWSVDPLSLGAAVFDGIAADGQAYRPGVLGNDSLTDALVSPYFNLTGQSNGVLSFYLQQGGQGDPTETQDSLLVHFWNPSTNAWEHGWGLRGGANTGRWHAQAIALPAHLNGQNGVRFRVSRYGSPGGAFDHFLLDYLEFGMARTLSDTALFDPAWSRVPSGLFRAYSELPWWHYSAFVLERDSLATAYRRNGAAPVGGWQLNLGKYVWKDDAGNVVASRSNVPVVTTLNHNSSTPYPFALTKPNLQPLGPQTYHFTGWFDGENVGELSNDTLYIDQPLHARYGLDDGTAERSYGVSQGTSPQWAQQFEFLQSDTLRGVDLSFVPAGFDWAAMTFQLGVWEVDTAGLPGQVLYLSDSAYLPELPYAGDPFRHYVLDTLGLVVPKNVYIGLIQTTGPAITVGLDLSGDAPKAYGDYAGWFPSLLPGRLMIRPFFRGLPQDLQLDQIPSELDFVYPNPAQDVLRGPSGTGEAVVYSAYGQEMGRFAPTPGWELPVSDWPAGMYVLHFEAGPHYVFMIQR